MCGKCIRSGCIDTYKERLKNAIIERREGLRDDAKKIIGDTASAGALGVIQAKLFALNDVLRIIDTTP